MFKVYGILATESVDRTGESLSLEGADISDLKYINDEHQSNHCYDILGGIEKSKKILSEAECEDEYQWKCWNYVKKPFIYVSGSIASPDHPNAQAAEGLIKYSLQNPQFPVGFSVEGATLERRGKILAKTKIVAASLTVKPCNPECRVFPVIDLTKSMSTVVLPERYRNWNSEGRKSFYNIPSTHKRLLAKSELIKGVNDLLKSGMALEDAAIIKCWNCGEAKLFMKMRLPNRCTACSEPFHMNDIWKALNSKNPVT